MSEKIPGLGSLQSEVMELVWTLEEATVAQLVDAIGKRRSVSYTTVLSAVQKLEKKGWLQHRTEGRAYVFRAARERTEVGQNKLGELLKTVFSGDPRMLLSSLIDEAGLSDSELSELRNLIDERRKATANKKGRRNGE
ncbi:BlaI/MecI/CopY family transcriptional regulator [Allorhodopirellula solitaria]|uniref:Penicillinase repressor n=1 Tax=Allorhodopirellula solitaria TaxID=2527987 RepID=A0A5C5WY44_9BACT|nr:BlaI/MecI/CopY family transcriptional regulator [Allorhodopirellula solitaria]TWT55500.1 Penicillinase repressor [Allorhodopirellula solitaria]